MFMFGHIIMTFAHEASIQFSSHCQLVSKSLKSFAPFLQFTRTLHYFCYHFLHFLAVRVNLYFVSFLPIYNDQSKRNNIFNTIQCLRASFQFSRAQKLSVLNLVHVFQLSVGKSLCTYSKSAKKHLKLIKPVSFLLSFFLTFNQCNSLI